MFPKVPQSSLGIVRAPQLPPPLGHPPLKNLVICLKKTKTKFGAYHYDVVFFQEMPLLAIADGCVLRIFREVRFGEMVAMCLRWWQCAEGSVEVSKSLDGIPGPLHVSQKIWAHYNDRTNRRLVTGNVCGF